VTPRAALGGVLKHVSPTQITTHKRCKRRWYLEKIQLLPQPQKPWLKTGENGHKEFQDFYELGTLPSQPSVKKLVTELADELPRPGPNVLIEHPRDYNLALRAADVPVKGRADLKSRYDPTTVIVVDLKSSKDITKYAKTPEELAHNVQLLTYAEDEFRARPETTVAQLAHAYVSTRGAKAKVVWTDHLSREYVSDFFHDAIETEVEDMKVTAQAPAHSDVEPNWEACGDYGGCPYQSVCGVGATATSAFQLLFTKDSRDVKDSKAESESEVVMGSLKDLLEKKGARAQGINPPDAAKPIKDEPKTEIPPPEPKLEVGDSVPSPASPTSTPATPETEPRVHLLLADMDGEPVLKDGILVSDVAQAMFPTAPKSPDLVLLIDVATPKLPKGVFPEPTIALEDEIEIRSKVILEEARKIGKASADTTDVREIPYGEGKTALVASFRTRPLTGTVMASSAGLSSDVIEILKHQATVVLRRAG
jgi:hypothetical protein